ncbi:MAG TPA: hypothetical protein G4O14_14520 [Anaerolineae bacterium]|nr:hypothetical protein [Anaerolineae bacterium]
MTPRHPFEWISPSAQKCVFWILLILTFFIMATLRVLDVPLKTEIAPSGIVSFEFAGDLSLAQKMVESWGQRGQIVAGLSLGLDYLFLLTYAGSIGMGCVLVARSVSKLAKQLSNAGIYLAWALLLAALLDALENYALIRVLSGSNSAIWPKVATWCAVPKFVIVAAGLAYILIGAVVSLLSRQRAI